MITNTINMAGELKKLPHVSKVISSYSQMDGTAVLVQGTDDVDYEIIIRPAYAATHPKIKADVKKRGTDKNESVDMKSFNELQNELTESTSPPSANNVIVPAPKNTSGEVIAIYTKLTGDSTYTRNGVYTREGTKLNKVLKGLGYWVSNTQGKTKLNKVGYDSQGKKIVSPRGNNK